MNTQRKINTLQTLREREENNSTMQNNIIEITKDEQRVLEKLRSSYYFISEYIETNNLKMDIYKFSLNDLIIRDVNEYLIIKSYRNEQIKENIKKTEKLASFFKNKK